APRTVVRTAHGAPRQAAGLRAESPRQPAGCGFDADSQFIVGAAAGMVCPLLSRDPALSPQKARVAHGGDRLCHAGRHRPSLAREPVMAAALLSVPVARDLSKRRTRPYLDLRVGALLSACL